MNNDNDMVPDQHSGSEKNIQHSITCDSEDEAKKIFEKGRERLLDVNHWNEWCGYKGTDFCLMDDDGEHLEGVANEGDFIRIDIPGPGSKEGKGFDWVQIVGMKDEDGQFDMMVKPAKDPSAKSGAAVAHFFDKEASSTFEISMHDKEVRAAVMGRNESANTEVSSMADKLRNIAVSSGAAAGFADLQWKKLVKGVLEKD